MLGEHYGDDGEYADSRLRGTVVKHNNIPVFVEAVIGTKSKNLKALVRNLLNSKTTEVLVKELDLCPFKLGFVNYQGCASYICRMPKRRDFKQGLRHGNICSQFGYHSDQFSYEDLCSTILGQFPKYKECVEAVNNPESNIESMAWGHDWAVDNEGNLLYKFGEVVGSVVKGVPVLLDNKKHLEQYLKEVIYANY